MIRLTHDELLIFGERVHNVRNNIGMTQEYVSGEIGISLRFYQMIERGEKSLSLDTLMGIGRVLNVSVDYLLFGNPLNNADNPIAKLFKQLPPRQREDATKILQLYANACINVSEDKIGDV